MNGHDVELHRWLEATPVDEKVAVRPPSFRKLVMVLVLTVDADADDGAVICAVEDAVVEAATGVGVRSVSVGMPHMHLPKAVGR